MKKYIRYLVVFAVCITSCEDEYFPSGFFPYQVEYMLTNDDRKTWLIEELSLNGEIQAIEECADSVRWQFEMIASDSISAYQLIFDEECMFFDTLVMGSLRASGNANSLFTDTLYLEQQNGSMRTMYVHEITAGGLNVSYNSGGISNDVYLELIKNGYLSRQARRILGGTESVGRTWELQALGVDGRNISIDSCNDVTYFKFYPESNDLRLEYLEPEGKNCADLKTTDYGIIELKSDDGYFSNQATLSGDAVPELQFTSFSTSTFQVNYFIQDTIRYVSTYRRLDE